MSKPRYGWWSYAKDMIRRYPALCKEYEDLHAQCIIPQYSGMPTGGGNARKVEAVAVRTLEQPYQKELDSVEAAVRFTGSYKDGDERLRLIELVYWKRSHTLTGAAMQCHVDYSTAKRWHNDFIRCVGMFFGLLPKEENEGKKTAS